MDNVTKKAKKLALIHPAVTYTVALGIVFIGYNIIQFTIAAISVGLLLLGAGIVVAAINFTSRSDHFLSIALSAEHERQAAELRNQVESIKKELITLNRRDGVDQLTNLVNKINHFDNTILARFKGQGLAYNRFQGVSDTILQNALETYGEIILQLKQYQTIDVGRCRSDIASLRYDQVGNKDQIEAIRTRIRIAEDILERVAKMIRSNEAAITKLDLTMESFANLNTERELEWALSELTSLSTALSTSPQHGELS